MIILAAQSESRLATLIEKARVAYGRGHPTMTDLDYDKLEEELRAINPKHPVLKHSGAHVPTKMKVRLPYPMPSLLKRKYLTGTVAQWLAGNPGPYVASWKMDGISALKQVTATVTKLFTRGRSGDNMGGDISFLIPHIKSSVKTKTPHVVRGELLMKNKVFSNKWAADFANPRNMAGGLTNTKSVHPGVKDLDFVAYELIEPRMKPSAAFAKLKAMGYQVAPFKVVPTLTEERLLKLLKAARANPHYEVDGLVIAVDKKTPISRTDPDHTIAFKSDTEDASAVTTVLDIEWNLTRTGFFFPRVSVKPVRLKGVTVKWASAKSADFVKENGIGPGAVIRLRRSGDVIPDINADDVMKRGKLKWPKVPYEWQGANIRVPKGTAMSNDVRVMRLTHFFVTLGIERFKDATVAKYVDAGFDTPRKILRMTEAQFSAVDGVSKTSRVIYQKIAELKNGVDLGTLMYASMVFGRSFGSRKFAAIIAAHPNIMDRADMSVAKLTQMIDDVPGFDVKQAAVFAEGLPKFVKFAAALGLPLLKKKRVVRTSTKLDGQAVLFTGFRNPELEGLIVKNGGTIATSVKNATILLAKDPSSGSSKLANARQLGTRIMSEQQFRLKYGI